jgi:uncharacterized membrane protein
VNICILGFAGSHTADDAYAEVLGRGRTDNRWLLEVVAIARPRVGRVRVGVTFPDGEFKTVEKGDLAKAAPDLGGLTGCYVSALAGPFGMFAAAEGEAAGAAVVSDVERRLFHLDDVKKALPHDSSALILIADGAICDALVETFTSYGPEVIWRQVEPELRSRLEALLENRAAQHFAETDARTRNP